jgi:hypothetical protein
MTEALAHLLAEHRGVVSADAVLAAGVDPLQLRIERRTGVYRTVNRRVLVHESAPPDRITDILLAAACTPGAIVTGSSAAMLRSSPAWDSFDFAGYPPLLIAPRSRPGRARTVRHPGANFSEVLGVRVADHHTTLVDLLRFLPWRLASAIAGASNNRRLADHDALSASLATLRGSAGAPQLAVLVRAIRNGAQSGPEVDLQQALHHARIKGWVGNPLIEVDGEVWCPDIVFPKEGVALEYDGYEEHSGKRAFQADREKICEMVFDDWVVLPLTSDVLYVPDRLAGFIANLRDLRNRRRKGGRRRHLPLSDEDAA